VKDQFERLSVALRGRYTLLRQLGKGGMGTVYLARDVKLGREVAVKALLPEVRAAFGDERFQLEVQLVARFSHPNIVKLFEAGEAEGIPFYVMDFVEGESLQQHLEREGQIGLKRALRIAAATRCSTHTSTGPSIATSSRGISCSPAIMPCLPTSASQRRPLPMEVRRSLILEWP